MSTTTPSSFLDSNCALDVLHCLRSQGPSCAISKLNQYLSSNITGPLLTELFLRLNSRKGPHLVIDGIWFQQEYGGISRVWQSLLHTFRLSSLFPPSSPLTFIQRVNNGFCLDQFDIIQSSQYGPFDYSSFNTISNENESILNRFELPVFLSSWVTTCFSRSVFPHLNLLHDVIPEIFRSSNTNYLNCRQRWLSSASSTLAVSHSSASLFKQLYPSANNIQWCYPPRPSYLSNLPSDSELSMIWESIANHFGTAKGYFFLPSSASLHSYKNPEVLLRSLCDPRLSDYHLIVSGQGDSNFRHELRSQFPDLIHRIHFAGFTDLELIAVYKHVICIVVPSLIEGFGLPVVEASYLGCISLIADSPGLIEAGFNCSLRFPSSDSSYLAELLVSMTDPISFQWYKSKLLPRCDFRCSFISEDLFGLCLLAQARKAFELY
ncbi:glycosyltransferase family 4 protein [Synechococcus sp. HB1133]|uniref:glycosyltransferase n=1 Tax=unclassified Synechococcus TaxID=2626047 RepID=UPI00140B090D|nr:MULTISPECIES: glycosyltransferase [unclassified Synechococcus]MCB4421442.1 glycosyltransferase family 4 protein [Synechococcus sp. HB1133]MCB4431207.1 glycosyltransferase family 4 protein [Synechococcus sp. HBA1120]NHI80384.1 glycosyltransferase [Synechococcus sp. HB1133]